MGPKLTWFPGLEYNTYIAVEWNPYVRGARTISGENRDVDGSSYGVSLGYRMKFTKTVGFGASISYMSVNFVKETIDKSVETISDQVTFVLPMLELTVMF